jgi:hypothetical protein
MDVQVRRALGRFESVSMGGPQCHSPRLVLCKHHIPPNKGDKIIEKTSQTYVHWLPIYGTGNDLTDIDPLGYRVGGIALIGGIRPINNLDRLAPQCVEASCDDGCVSPTIRVIIVP